MTADTWASDGRDSLAQGLRSLRMAFRVLLWTTVLIGPLIVGGVAGWVATSGGGVSGILEGTLGAAPAQSRPATITDEELEAVGLNAERLRSLTTR